MSEGGLAARLVAQRGERRASALQPPLQCARRGCERPRDVLDVAPPFGHQPAEGRPNAPDERAVCVGHRE
jgi:hypothetical protein